MSLKSPFTTEIGRGSYSAIVFIDGDLVVAEDNIGTIIKENANATIVIQAALDKIATHGSGKLVQLEGTYTWTSAITYSASNLEWEGIGNVINDCSAIGTGGALKIQGAVTGTNSALTVNAAKGQKNITVTDGSSFSAGDWIRIRSETIFNSGSTHLGELQKIASIAGNVITCEDVLAFTYTTADTATMDLLTVYENIKLKNMDFIGHLGVSSWEGFAFEELFNVLIEDIKWTDSQCYPIRIFDGVGFEVRGCFIKDSDESGLGYGVVVANASRDILIHDNIFHNCRHGVACGSNNTYGIQTNQVYDSNIFRYSTQHACAMGPHNTYDGLVISNNTVMNDGLTYVGGLNTIIVGNYIYNDACSIGGIRTKSRGSYVTVTGNTIIASSSNIAVRLEGSHIIINGNYIQGDTLCIFGSHEGSNISIVGNIIKQTGSSQYAVTFKTSDGTAVVKNFMITENDISSNYGGIKFEGCAYNLEHIIINGNLIETSDTALYFTWSTGAGICKYLKVSNNIIKNASYGISMHGIDYFDITDNLIDTITNTGITINATAPSCHYYSVEGNRIINVGTAISDGPGTAYPLCHNIGYVTENTVLSNTFAIDSTGVKTVTIAHGLAITPPKQDCHLTVIENTNVDDWGFDLLKVDSTDATNVTAKIHVSNASATGSATAKLALRVGKL